MIINVTQTHIENGLKNCYLCPVAQAIKDTNIFDYLAVVDADKHSSYNLVYVQGIEYKKKYIKLPRSVQRFIRAFDKGKPVKPFNFKLDLI